jgi:hypothetical protein
VALATTLHIIPPTVAIGPSCIHLLGALRLAGHWRDHSDIFISDIFISDILDWLIFDTSCASDAFTLK